MTSGLVGIVPLILGPFQVNSVMWPDREALCRRSDLKLFLRCHDQAGGVDA